MSTPVVEARIRIEATRGDVYRALTDEAGLQEWFAEHARVDIDAGRYEFSGRYTLGTPEQSTPGMELQSAVPNERLIYSWPLDGTPSIVAIELADDGGDSCVLNLDHDNLSGTMPWLIEAFWSMALENLRAYVERGEAGLRFDFSNIPYGDVRIETEIDAEQVDVFAALIDPAQLDRYMSEKPAVIDARVGGSYDLGWSSEGPVQILELESGKRLSYSWQSDKQDATGTVVTWELEGSQGRTRLTLVHSGFAPDRAGMDYGLGWLDFLNRIKQMTEMGDRWNKPSLRVNEDRNIRDEGLYLPAAGIHEAIASAPSRTNRQRVR